MKKIYFKIYYVNNMLKKYFKIYFTYTFFFLVKSVRKSYTEGLAGKLVICNNKLIDIICI